MPISDFLLQEFDAEMATTRKALERVPADKGAFAPHTKSMKMQNLAPHVAQLPQFGLTVLTTPELDFGTTTFTRLPFESPAQLVSALDEGAAKTRAALKATPDSAWSETWKLSFQGKPVYSGTRFMAYRQMFLNHIVHHRAQLGVYLRMNNVEIPGMYGPSADEKNMFAAGV
jgi:uncharacterized damage-inducible protein DinB